MPLFSLLRKHSPTQRGVYTLLCLFALKMMCALLYGCGGPAATFSAIGQSTVVVHFGTGTTAPASTLLDQNTFTVTATCNGTSYPPITIQGAQSLSLLTGLNCQISLTSFTMASSREVFTATTPAIVGLGSSLGVYVGSAGTHATITPYVTTGSLYPLQDNTQVVFVYQSTDTVVATLESGYSYLGVVSGQTSTFQFTFTTTANTASNLAIGTSGFPAAWSATTTTCALVNTQSTCSLTLTFAPSSADASTKTLTVPYTYITPDGNSHSATALLSYQGLNRLKWSYTVAAGVRPTVAQSADGQTVYFGAGDNKLYSLDAATGAFKWSFTAAGPAHDAILSADGSQVYFTADSGNAYAINTTTHAQTWMSAGCGGSSFAAPALSPDKTLLYMPCYTPEKIFAFNTATGATSWSTASLGNIFVSQPEPSLDGTSVFIAGTGTNSLHKYDTTTHTPTAYSPGAFSLQSSPLLSADQSTVYLGSSTNNKLYAVNASTMTLKWSSNALGGAFGGSRKMVPSLDNSMIYVVTDDGYLYAFSTTQTNGSTTVAWDWKSPTGVGTSIAGNQTLSKTGTSFYTGGSLGIYSFNLVNNGSLNWSYATTSYGTTNAVSADGYTLYAGTMGYFYAFNESVIKR